MYGQGLALGLADKCLSCLSVSASKLSKRLPAAAGRSATAARTATATATVRSATAARSRRGAALRLRFINRDLAASEILHVGCGDRISHLLGIYIDEAKAASFDDSSIASSKLFEVAKKVSGRKGVRQVADE